MNQTPIFIDLDHCRWIKVTVTDASDDDHVAAMIDLALEHARHNFDHRSQTIMLPAFWRHYLKSCAVVVKFTDPISGSSTAIWNDTITNKALAKVDFVSTSPSTQTATIWAPLTKRSN